MMSEMETSIIFFSHGGGPLPLLADPGHKAMINFMTELPRKLPKPEAILVISAHWEQPTATILGSHQPSMFYDYYGFPPAAYEIDYPAPGHPVLAEKIVSVLNQAGIKSQIDTHRGFDHGLFIPLNLMYPHAKIPALQLSLLDDLSPTSHLELGKSLRALRMKNRLSIRHASLDDQTPIPNFYNSYFFTS